MLLVALDDKERETLRRALLPFATLIVATDGIEALERLGRGEVECCIVALSAPPEPGLELLDDLLATSPAGAFVVVVPEDEPELLSKARERGVPCLPRGAGDDILAEAVVLLVNDASSAAALRGRATRLRQFLSALDEAIFVCSPTRRVTFMNEPAAELVAVNRERLYYRDIRAAALEFYEPTGRRVPPDELPITVALQTGTVVPSRLYRARRGDGELRWFTHGAHPLIDEGRRPFACVASMRDVTEWKAATDALVDSERRRRLLLEHAAEAYVVLDEAGLVVDVSESASRLVSPSLGAGRRFRDFLHRNERLSFFQSFDTVVNGPPGAPLRGEYRLIETSDPACYIELTLTNRLDEPSISGVVLNLRDITERKIVEEQMARLSAIVEHSEDSIIAENLDGTITSWNPASERLYGYSAEQALGESALVIVPIDLLAEVIAVRERIAAGERVEVAETRRLRRDGSVVDVSLTVSPIYDAAGGLVGASSIARDITERLQLEAARRRAEARVRLGFERGAIGLAVSDLNDVLVEVNDALCELLGREKKDVVLHRVSEFMEDRDEAAHEELRLALAEGTVDRVHEERRLRRSDGEVLEVVVDTSRIVDPGGATLLFAQVQDVTARVRSEAALVHQALHDTLTGLPNRALLIDRLERTIRRSAEHGTSVAVVFVDVDRFKTVNDSLGHAAGDELLVEVARRLLGAIGQADTVARLGGDEFIVVFDYVADEAEARSFGRRVAELFETPFSLEDTELFVTASVGVVVSTADMSSDEALRAADSAMYRAKNRGRGHTELFDDDLRRDVELRVGIESALRRALDANELLVEYQPILTLGERRLAGVEALVRWHHPERGRLMPSVFLAAAEETGLIVPIGDFVLDAALRQGVTWRKTLPGCESLVVSVNLSARELVARRPADFCATALERVGAPADLLHFEIAEDAVMADIEAAIGYVDALAALGVATTIDHVGAGHSALGHLRRLPVAGLKIDRSFVSTLVGPNDDSPELEVVRAIIELGRKLSLEVQASGIEHAGQAQLLGDLGCALGQGRHFAPPLRPESFERFVTGLSGGQVVA